MYGYSSKKRLISGIDPPGINRFLFVRAEILSDLLEVKDQRKQDLKENVDCFLYEHNGFWYNYTNDLQKADVGVANLDFVLQGLSNTDDHFASVHDIFSLQGITSGIKRKRRHHSLAQESF